MRLKKAALLCLAAVVLVPAYARAEEITMDEYFKRIRATHPVFRKEALSVEIVQWERERLKGAEDWLVLSNPYYSHEENAYVSPFMPRELDSAGVDATLRRDYWATGGRLSLSYGYTFIDQLSDDIVIPLEGSTMVLPAESGAFNENAFSLTYTHPLLKNRGGLLSRLRYELQGYSVKAAALGAAEAQEGFLLEVGQGFLKWALLTEQLGILTDRLDIANRELGRTEKKRRQNLVEKVDVIRTRDAVLSARNNVLLARSALRATREELAVLAQIEVTDGPLTPSYGLYEEPGTPSIEEALARLRERSRVLGIRRAMIELAGHGQKGAKEELKPRLDLMLKGALAGGGESFEDSFGFDKPSYLAALSLSFPLQNTSARAGLGKARAEAGRAKEEMREAELSLEASLRRLTSQIEEFKDVLALNRERVATAKQRTEAELVRYNQGRVELTFVLMSRDSELAARLERAKNAARYHRLLLVYSALTDTLFEPAR